jgi:hypothetical protein
LKQYLKIRICKIFIKKKNPLANTKGLGVKNQADLARKLSISRARVTQILNLLKLDKSIMDNLKKIGDPMEKIISERKLRKIIPQNSYSRTNYK